MPSFVTLEKAALIREIGSSALQAASLKGYTTIVSRLIESGANVNARNGHFGNALQAACYGGDINIVRSLLHAGADVNLEGLYPLTL